ACKDPAGVYQCHDDGSGPYGDGIQNVHFHVTNSLIGQDLKGVILKIPPSPAGTNDHVYFISRQDKYTGNGNFYGEGSITDLREVMLSRLDPQTGALLTGTRMSLGFGPDDPNYAMRVYADLNDGVSSELLDAVMNKPAKTFNVCIRPGSTDKSAQANDTSSIWCERQNPAAQAVQLGVDLPASGRRPDIHVNRLLFQNLTAKTTIAGTADIYNLGDRIDVLSGGDLLNPADDPSKCIDGQSDVLSGSAAT